MASSVSKKGVNAALPTHQDSTTGAINTVDYEHHEIHSGSHYYVEEQNTLGNGDSLVIVIATPNTAKWGHVLYRLDHTAELTFTITEGVSTSADGTALTSFNNNRNSANTADIVLTHTPTSPTGGTIIYGPVVSGSGKLVGGLSRNETEIILKQNTKYLVELDNNVAGDNVVDVIITWYEHTDRT